MHFYLQPAHFLACIWRAPLPMWRRAKFSPVLTIHINEQRLVTATHIMALKHNIPIRAGPIDPNYVDLRAPGRLE